jgi:hypothetical protein
MELASRWPQLFSTMVFISTGPVTGIPIMKEDEVKHKLIYSFKKGV